MNNEKKQDMGLAAAPQYYYPPYPQADEINLLDIWRILAKRKKLIIAISLLITLAGSAYALLKPETYTYSTAIQIGSMSGKPVDEIKNVESKVKEAYIAAVLNDFYRDNPNHPKNIKIDVSVPKGSEILIVGSKCPDKQAQLCQQLINKISAKLGADHGEKIKMFRDALSEQIVNAKKRLELLEDNEKALNKRMEGFDKTGLQDSSNYNSGTVALVMIELSQQQLQISSEKFNLQSQLVNNVSQMNLIQDTKLLNPVTKSIDTMGLGKILLIISFAFIGLFLGVLMALVWDFIEKMKGQLVTVN